MLNKLLQQVPRELMRARLVSSTRVVQSNYTVELGLLTNMIFSSISNAQGLPKWRLEVLTGTESVSLKLFLMKRYRREAGFQ